MAGLEAGADVAALDAANAAAGADPAAAAKLSFTELREIILAGAGAGEAASTPAFAKKTRGGRSGGGDSKTQEDAQEAGALALKRAAEGSGKKGHYNWEGVDYTKKKAEADKSEIADAWVESVGQKRRERIATVEYVDAGAGRGMQAVSRISIREAREAEDRERRAAAAREAARLPIHDLRRGTRLSAMRTRRRREGVPETAAAVFGAGGGGGAAAVPQLPARHVAGVRAARHQAAWAGSARSTTARAATAPPARRAGSCSGAGCPTAFCAECNGETPFEAVEANAEWEALGFYLPKSFEYVRCGNCGLAKGEEEAKETPAKGGSAAKKQRRR